MAPKSHELHFQPDREQLFAQLPDGLWQERTMLANWVVADPALLTEFLRHPKASLPNWESLIEKSEKALGRRLENLRRASRCAPLLLKGEEHAALRKALAIYLSERLAVLEERLPQFVSETLTILNSPGRLDLYQGVVNPLIGKVTEVLTGCALPADLDSAALLQVFPAIRSPSQTSRTDAEFGRLFAVLAPHVSSEMDMACRVSCLIFGVDTQAMMLVESMLRSFRETGAAQGAQLPEFPVETGVPVLTRSSDENWSAGNTEFSPEEVVRLQLQPLGYSKDPRHNAAIFGLGAHSCVGKQVSLRVWHHLRTEFNRIAPIARVLEYKLHPSAFMCTYDRVMIEVMR